MLQTVLMSSNHMELSDRHASRINAVKGIRIENDRTIDLVKKIQLFKDTALGGGESASASLTAPTRGGKTTIIDTFMAKHPPIREGAADRVPVVYVEVPSGATTKTLGRAALTALNHLNPEKGDGDFKRVELVATLRRRGTTLVIFDELQRLVEKDRGKVSKNVSDWIQNLINNCRGMCAVLLVGTTRARSVFAKNGHLIGRNDFHWEVEPYQRNPQQKDDWERYRAYLANFDHQFVTVADFSRSDFAKSDIAARIHAASLGYPGATAKLLQIAATDAIMQGSNVVDNAILASAFDRLWKFSHAVALNPFTSDRPLLPKQVWKGPWEEILD